MIGEGRDWETESRPTEAHAAVKTDPNAGCAIGADGNTKHSLALVVGMRPHRKHAGAPHPPSPTSACFINEKRRPPRASVFRALKNPGAFSTQRKRLCVRLKFSRISGRRTDLRNCFVNQCAHWLTKLRSRRACRRERLEGTKGASFSLLKRFSGWQRCPRCPASRSCRSCRPGPAGSCPRGRGCPPPSHPVPGA